MLPEAGDESRPAVVRDFSKAGLRLCADFALDLGDAVQVDVRDDRFFGRVAHCHAEGAWYILGLALGEPISEEKLDRLIRDLSLTRHR